MLLWSSRPTTSGRIISYVSWFLRTPGGGWRKRGKRGGVSGGRGKQRSTAHWLYAGVRHTILVDAALVGKGVAANNGLVQLNVHARVPLDHLFFGVGSQVELDRGRGGNVAARWL